MVREEYNLPLTPASYQHLLSKADENKITKKRYLIPPSKTSLTIELDVFLGYLSGLILAEVEFPDEAAADAFTPPDGLAEKSRIPGCITILICVP